MPAAMRDGVMYLGRRRQSARCPAILTERVLIQVRPPCSLPCRSIATIVARAAQLVRLPLMD